MDTKHTTYKHSYDVANVPAFPLKLMTRQNQGIISYKINLLYFYHMLHFFPKRYI